MTTLALHTRPTHAAARILSDCKQQTRSTPLSSLTVASSNLHFAEPPLTPPLSQPQSSPRCWRRRQSADARCSSNCKCNASQTNNNQPMPLLHCCSLCRCSRRCANVRFAAAFVTGICRRGRTPCAASSPSTHRMDSSTSSHTLKSCGQKCSMQQHAASSGGGAPKCERLTFPCCALAVPSLNAMISSMQRRSESKVRSPADLSLRSWSQPEASAERLLRSVQGRRERRRHPRGGPRGFGHHRAGQGGSAQRPR